MTVNATCNQPMQFGGRVIPAKTQALRIKHYPKDSLSLRIKKGRKKAAIKSSRKSKKADPLKSFRFQKMLSALETQSSNTHSRAEERSDNGSSAGTSLSSNSSLERNKRTVREQIVNPYEFDNLIRRSKERTIQRKESIEAHQRTSAWLAEQTDPLQEKNEAFVLEKSTSVKGMAPSTVQISPTHEHSRTTEDDFDSDSSSGGTSLSSNSSLEKNKRMVRKQIVNPFEFDNLIRRIKERTIQRKEAIKRLIGAQITPPPHEEHSRALKDDFESGSSAGTSLSSNSSLERNKSGVRKQIKSENGNPFEFDNLIRRSKEKTIQRKETIEEQEKKIGLLTQQISQLREKNDAFVLENTSLKEKASRPPQPRRLPGAQIASHTHDPDRTTEDDFESDSSSSGTSLSSNKSLERNKRGVRKQIVNPFQFDNLVRRSKERSIQRKETIKEQQWEIEWLTEQHDQLIEMNRAYAQENTFFKKIVLPSTQPHKAVPGSDNILDKLKRAQTVPTAPKSQHLVPNLQKLRRVRTDPPAPQSHQLLRAETYLDSNHPISFVQEEPS
jgi:regulator of replication initiation timing